MTTAIQVENLSKAYQLGNIGTGTISKDIHRWWTTRILQQEDPFLKIGELNDRSTSGKSDVVWSLKDLNFSIEQGEAVGIIGRNGAGKSTLLKLLSRITSPTTGSIKLKGRVASLLEVGTGFHPELTGRENIYLNGAILGMRKKEISRKMDEIIAFSGVERYIDTPVKRYSSGMYVRLAFAVAAHLESEILIVDEVLAVGDAEFQKKCLGKMSDINAGEGRTVLFVSHNMAAVTALCSKSIVLKDGQKVFDGPQQEGVKYYLSQQHHSSVLKRTWIENEAPGDSRARILGIEAMATTGQTINFESGITLVFTIKSNIENSLLDISFNVKNHDQTLLFHHGNSITESTLLQTGVYIVKAAIPSYMLNEGSYYIDAWLGLGGTEVVGKVEENLISFDMERSHIDHIIKSTPGVLRPKLLYTSEYVD